jgi:predicted acetyltransferase
VNLLLKNINKSERKIFNNLAKNYYLELNKKFKATTVWKKKKLFLLINDNSKIIKWICFEKNKIGFLILDKILNPFTKQKKIIIQDYFLIKKYRRKKIGVKIFQIIKDFAKKNKFQIIEVETLFQNKKAFNFWRKLKFKPISIKSKLYL